MADPKISVIVPVYNCRDTVRRALDSAFAQTMPAAELEIIAVDDGSTDGSGELLDELAAGHANLTVVHIANSGGPGRPRNVALDRATGEFVFFLDADDYLGPDALRRMHEAAVANDTDIVVGKMVPVDNRTVSSWVYQRTLPRTTIFDSPAYWTLYPQKLMRRRMIEDNKIRFPEGLLSSSDLPFTSHAYLHARAITMLGDYDYYFLVRRPDHSSVTQRGGADRVDLLNNVAEMIESMARHVPPGPDRDQLLHIHLRLHVLDKFNQRYLEYGPDGRREMAAAGRKILDAWLSEEVLATLAPLNRLRAYCLRNDLPGELETIIRQHVAGEGGEPVGVDGRVFLRYAHFRDPDHPIPDSCFEVTDDITMWASVTETRWRGPRLELRGRVGARVAGRRLPQVWPTVAGVVLRHPRTKDRRVFPARTDGEDFQATLDLRQVAPNRPLAPGNWLVGVELDLLGHRRRQKLRVAKPDPAPEAGSTAGAGQGRAGQGRAGRPLPGYARRRALTASHAADRQLTVTVTPVRTLLGRKLRPLARRLRGGRTR